MKLWKYIPLPLAIAVPGILIITAIATSKPKPTPDLGGDREPPRVKIEVREARPQRVALSVSSQGTVAPKREIDLVAQVSGQVQAVEAAFVHGGFFAANQLLLQIEDRDYRAALLTAEANLADAGQRLAEERGRARQAQREWRDLGNHEANELFLRKPQLTAAEAGVASARARVAQAQLNLERTQIRVPFDGRVRATDADLGQYVTPGTRLASVYDTAVAEIRLPLTDRQAALVDLPLGYAAARQEEGPRVTISGIIAGERYQWRGHIARTDASIDVDSRMYFAVAEVANPFSSRPDRQNKSHPLVVGLFVEALIEGKALDDVIVLPREAVFNRDQIYVLNEQRAIEQKSVTVLQKTRDTVWLRSELAADTLIVVEKQSLVAPGTIVDPLLKKSAPAVAAVTAGKAAASVKEAGGE